MFVSCGQCKGEKGYVWSMDNPELCKCDREPRGSRVWTTSQFMKILRRVKWEEIHDWEEEDMDRIVDSSEANQEDIQDFEDKMLEQMQYLCTQI